MRRIFLMASFLFLGLSFKTFASGIQLEAGMTFLGNTEIEMLGTNTLTGSTVSVTPDHKPSYTFSGGYSYDLRDRISIKGALAYSAFTTKAISLPGSVDNGTYDINFLDIVFMGQFDVTNEISFRVGTSLPILTKIKGSLDNTSNIEEYDLDNGMSLGFNMSLGYNFRRDMSFRFGYVMSLASKSKAARDLDVKITSSYWKFVFGYEF